MVENSNRVKLNKVKTLSSFLKNSLEKSHFYKKVTIVRTHTYTSQSREKILSSTVRYITFFRNTDKNLVLKVNVFKV